MKLFQLVFLFALSANAFRREQKDVDVAVDVSSSGALERTELDDNMEEMMYNTEVEKGAEFADDTEVEEDAEMETDDETDDMMGTDEMMATFPTVLTWNAGGGEPKPEFLGGNWMAQPAWNEAERAVGTTVLQLLGLGGSGIANLTEKGFDYSRYTTGTTAGIETQRLLAAQGLLPSGTVGQLLSGLEESAKKFGLDTTKWECYKDLPLTKVFDHAFNDKALPLFSGVGICDAPSYGLLPQRIFKGPDGCFANRHSRWGLGKNFLELIKAKTDKKFWAVWVMSLAKSEWGPKKFCSSASGQIFRSMRANQTGKNSYENDWIAMAIWDRFLVRVTKESFRANGVKLADVSIIDELPEADINAFLTEKIELLSATADVLLLQEPPKGIQQIFAATHDIRGFDAVVMVKKAYSSGVPTRTDEAEATLRNLQSESRQVVLPESANKAAKKQQKFWIDAAQAYMQVAVANDILFVSVHSDTDGYFCVEVLKVVQKLSIAMQLPAVLGIDSNVQRVPNKAQNGVRDLLSAAKKLKFKALVPASWRTNGLGYTVWKARSFVQAQIHKAAKLDKVAKDWLFWINPTKKRIKGIGKTNVYNQLGATNSFVDGSFPTEKFPADHAVVMTLGR